MKKNNTKPVRHHILYSYCGIKHEQKPWEVLIYPQEHWLSTQLQRRGKLVSQGFLTVLRHFILMHQDTAPNLRQTHTNTIQKVRANNNRRKGKINGNKNNL